MPDARGHGNSSAPLHGYRYEDHASDVIGLNQALRLDMPILLGYSMGCMTAAVVSNQSAKTTRGVILVDPTFLIQQRQHAVCGSAVAEKQRRLIGTAKIEKREAGKRGV